jgi:hypothetical protein
MVRYTLAVLLLGCLASLSYGDDGFKPVTARRPPRSASEEAEVKSILEEGREQIRNSTGNQHWMRLSVPVLLGETPTGGVIQGTGNVGIIAARVEVFQIIDKENMLVHIGHFGKSEYDRTIFWIKGFDTTGRTDESTGFLSCTVRYVGTQQYATLVGTRTVKVYEPYPLQLLAPVK